MSTELPKMGIHLVGIPPRDMLALAQEAEQAGFHFVATSDYSEDTFASLAAIAAVTQRITLVSNIATWTRTPVTMARVCRTLDLISDGRYILGLGSMPRVWNEDFHGIPGEEPLSRMREYVELVRMLWEATPDTPIDYEGRFYRVSGYRVPAPPPRPHLPIFIGATRRKMICETGMWADGILFNWNYTFPWLKEQAIPALAEGAKRSGRSLDDLETVVFRTVSVTDDPGEVARVRDGFRRHVSSVYLGLDYHQEMLTSLGFGEEVAAGTAALAAGDMEGAARAISDRIVDDFTIIGTADQCLNGVSEHTPYVGWFLLQPPFGGMYRSDSAKVVRRLIRTFGNTQH